MHPGLLRLSAYGKSIDSHETIVRVNQAPMRGYSRRVGLRVTHRVLNRLWTRNYHAGATRSRSKVGAGQRSAHLGLIAVDPVLAFQR